MPIHARCPACRQDYSVKDEMAGQQASCRCGQVFTIRPPSAPALPPLPPMPVPPPPPAHRSNVVPLLLLVAGLLTLFTLGAGALIVVLVLAHAPAQTNLPDESTTAIQPIIPMSGDPPNPPPAGKEDPREAERPSVPEKEKTPPADRPPPDRPSPNRPAPPAAEPGKWSDQITIALDAPPDLPPPPGLWTGHRAMIRGLGYSPDGKFAISASGDINDARGRAPDNTVRLWDARRARELKRLEGFPDGLSTVAFSPGGRHVALASAGRWVRGVWQPGKDRHVRLWDIQEGKELFGRKLVAGILTEDRDDTGKGQARFKGHTGEVSCVAFSPDGRRVAASSNDSVILVWETETGKQVQRFSIDQPLATARIIHSVAFSPDGKQLLSGGYDFSVRLWDIETGRQVAHLRSHTDIVMTVALSQGKDGRLHGLSGGGWHYVGTGFTRGTNDFTIRLWDVHAERIVQRFLGHTDIVQCVAFCPNGRHILSSSFDRTVRLWDQATGRQLRCFTGHTEGVRAITVSPDGKYALAGDDEGKIRLWRLPGTLENFLAVLEKKDATALEEAVKDLDVLGEDARKAVPGLLAVLTTDQPALRRAALAGLRLIRTAVGVDEVRKLLDSRHTEARLFACEALRALGAGASAALDELVRLMRHSSREPEVQRAAIRAVAVQGERARRAAATLAEIVLNGSDRLLLAEAAAALGQVGDNGADVVRALERALKFADREVRRAALRSLVLLAPRQYNLDLVLDARGDADAEVSRLAGELLKKSPPTGPEAARVFLRGVHSKQTAVRLDALHGLARLGRDAEVAVPVLLEKGLGDSDRTVRLHAALALAAIRPEEPEVSKRTPGLILAALRPATMADLKSDAQRELAEKARSALVNLGGAGVGALFRTLKTWGTSTSALRQEENALNAQGRLEIYRVLRALGPRVREAEKNAVALLAGRVDSEKKARIYIQRNDVLQAATEVFTLVQGK